ncbi:MAG TPA: MarR family transcriptional regulator [Gaiella sp.]|jgi:DNA-binding MarR family transcriptional regulator|nr:MarR family transcriptional regulator [Gaiella sp.]
MQTSFPELSARELAAWRGFLRVHSGIVRELNTELELTHALPLAHYEVLLYLDAAPCGKLTMSELAQSVLLSQSGVTRLVDRLVRSGLVVREGCSEDRRVMYARLTDEGREALIEARPTLIEGVRQRFLARFDDAELDVLADAWERVRPGATA